MHPFLMRGQLDFRQNLMQFVGYSLID